jgi:enamine deaminase RidA (YjgF/YER057c/UK114 family)
MSVEQKIKELGFELPPPPKSLGAYVQAARTGNLVFTAGQLPSREGRLICAGKVPTNVTIEEAQKAAQQAVLNGLAAISTVAPLDSIRRVVRLNVFVNSAPGFTEQAKAANGASELLAAIFGEAGKHTRSALGAAELPINAPLELDFVVEVA